MNTRCWSLAALAAALLAAPARPKPAAAPPESQHSTRIQSSLADALASDFDGERVFAVVNLFAPSEARDVRPPTDNKLLHRLQAVCESFSTEDRVLAPFAVRGTWVVAPLARDEVVFDYAGVSPLDALNRQALLERAVAAVPTARAAELGSDLGLPASSLPAESQAALLRALRPPLEVITSVPPYGIFAFGITGEYPPVYPTVNNLTGIRLRAQVHSSGIHMAEGGEAGGVRPDAGPGKRLLFSPYRGFQSAPVELSATRKVLNTFKASDLDGASYTEPLGFHGPLPLPDFLKRLSTATGLNLKASAQYDELFVLANSNAITQGEALDGLRLALTAAWRRTGDAWLLTWDRSGLGPMDVELTMRTVPLRQAAARLDAEDRESLTTNLAATLPFAADDPTPWTDEQRRRVFVDIEYEPDHGPIPGVPRPANIGFNDLTPAQKQVAKDEEERGLDGTTGQPLPRWDATKATLNDTLLMQISVQIPGLGWVQAPNGARLTGSEARVYAWMRKTEAAGARRPASSTAAPMAPPAWLAPQPDHRALMVPPLDRGALARLLPAMKANGYTTLFYPAFTGGCATFPTAAFPQWSGPGGSASLADAVRLAHANGIAIAAVVESMAWRPAGARDHWTDAAPNWLGRDVLGRTLTEAVAAYGGPVFARGDVARLSPETDRRLNGLLTDLARVKEVQGVVFDAWSVSTILSAPVKLPTGFEFGIPDRVASIQSDGVDLIDRPVFGVLRPDDQFAEPPPSTATGLRRAPGRSPEEPGYEALLGAQLRALRKARPDWTLYATSHDGMFGRPTALPNARTIRLSSGPFTFIGSDDSALAPVRPGDTAAQAAGRAGVMGRLRLMVYDVRDFPGDLAALLATTGAGDSPS